MTTESNDDSTETPRLSRREYTATLASLVGAGSAAGMLGSNSEITSDPLSGDSIVQPSSAVENALDLAGPLADRPSADVVPERYYAVTDAGPNGQSMKLTYSDGNSWSEVPIDAPSVSTDELSSENVNNRGFASTVSEINDKLSSYDEVVVVPGSYTVDTALSVPADTTLTVPQGATLTLAGGVTINVVELTGSNATVVVNGIIDGNDTNNSGNNNRLVYGSTVSTPTVRGNGTLQNPDGTNIRLEDCDDATVKGVTIDGGRQCVNIRGNSQRPTVHDVTAINSENDGILIFGSGSTRGTIIEEGRVTANRAKNNGGGGIFVSAFDDGVIADNVTRGNEDWGVNGAYSQHTSIVGNTSVNDRVTGVGSGSEGKFLTIVGNTIRDVRTDGSGNRGEGIAVINPSENCTINGNTIQSTGGLGIQYAGAGGTTSGGTTNGNTIINAGDSGIEFPNELYGHTCNNNTIINPSGDGVQYESGAIGGSICGNTIRGAGVNGIRCLSSETDLTINSNSITACSNYAINMAGSSTDRNSIQDNAFEANGTDGVTGAGTNSVVSGNV